MDTQQQYNDGTLVSNVVINISGQSNYYYYYTRLIASFPGHVGKPAPKRRNQFGFK